MSDLHEGSARDFDFLFGKWKVRNRKLRERLTGSNVWDEFEATNDARSLLGGIANQDEFRTEDGFIGMSFRFFHRETKQWAIHWASNRGNGLEPPVIGSFEDGVGTFEGGDVFEGRPIRVRYIWSRVNTPTPRWEQAYSADGGNTWETNWFMDFSRLAD